MDKIIIIIPCYNEELSIPYLKNKLIKIMDDMTLKYKLSFEVIMVDNCSFDNTLSLMKELSNSDSRFKYISFSQNFGKDSSMYTGLKKSTGDYLTIMDADLQDPPELLLEMYNIIKNENYDIVAAYRKNRVGEQFFSLYLLKCFIFDE